MKYVIIGHSAAAIGCIEGIRAYDTTGEILVLSDEAYATYSRPLISYLLQGKTDREKMRYRDDAFFETNGVTVRLSCRVQRIDAVNKQLTIDKGEQVPYDKLLVATGSRPFVVPIQGIQDVPYHTFMTLEDAQGIEAAIQPTSRVLIVGAGLIGLKCAEALVKKTASITVCDLAPNILSSILDTEGSMRVQTHIEKSGVAFKLGASVASVDGRVAVLQDGTEILYDVLVIASGVRPNTELVREAGGEVARGVVVDDACQTSLASIYSAGDCTESYDITTGQRKILALLPNAYWQGKCAGINMAGGHKVYEKAMPMNAIGFMGMHMITAGSMDGDEVYVEQTDVAYKKLVVRNNRLVGYVMVGDVKRAGIYTALIREQRDLGEVNFEMLKQKPQLMAFAKQERQQALGGSQ